MAGRSNRRHSIKHQSDKLDTIHAAVLQRGSLSAILERFGPWLLLVASIILQRYGFPPLPVQPPPPTIVQPPAPVEPPKPNNVDVENATVKLRMGSTGCTATIIGPQRNDKRWDCLTAAHCAGTRGARGNITLKDGRRFDVETVYVNRSIDIAWLRVDTVDSLPFAHLATITPAVNAQVFHIGYGVDRPGNKENGTVLRGGDANTQASFRLSVSAGDSGSGIFLADTKDLVGVVCCSDGRTTYGATGLAATATRPN